MSDTVNDCEIIASVDIGNEMGRYAMLYNPRNRVHPYVTAWLKYDEPDQWYWGEYLETIEDAKQSLFDRALTAL